MVVLCAWFQRVWFILVEGQEAEARQIPAPHHHLSFHLVPRPKDGDTHSLSKSFPLS